MNLPNQLLSEMFCIKIIRRKLSVTEHIANFFLLNGNVRIGMYLLLMDINIGYSKMHINTSKYAILCNIGQYLINKYLPYHNSSFLHSTHHDIKKCNTFRKIGHIASVPCNRIAKPKKIICILIIIL